MVELYEGVDSKTLFIGMQGDPDGEVRYVAHTAAGQFAFDAKALAETGLMIYSDRGFLSGGPGCHRSNCGLTVFQAANLSHDRREARYEPVNLIAYWREGTVGLRVPESQLSRRAAWYLDINRCDRIADYSERAPEGGRMTDRFFIEPEGEVYRVRDGMDEAPVSEPLSQSEAVQRRDALNGRIVWPADWMELPMGARAKRLGEHQWLISSAGHSGYFHLVTEQDEVRRRLNGTPVFPPCTCPDGYDERPCWHRQQARMARELAAGRSVLL